MLQNDPGKQKKKQRNQTGKQNVKSGEHPLHITLFIPIYYRSSVNDSFGTF